MYRTLAVLSAALLFTHPAAATHVMPEIIVPGHTEPDFTHVTITTDDQGRTAPDTARLLTVVPGAAYNDNGPLSGQVQYRGMFGPRMNVLVDGMYINSGGPNWMDPPLHYVPATLLGEVELTRGIGSVSSGPGIGGNIIATYLTSHFGDGSDFKLNGTVTLGGHTVDDGLDLGGMVAAANERHRFQLLGSYDKGNDRKFGKGEIAATEYSRSFLGAGYGIALGNQEFSLDYRRNETGDSGNPVLPLDIDFFDTDLLQLKHTGTFGDIVMHSQLYYTHVDHRMTNYLLRQPPDFSNLPLPPFAGTDRRFVDPTSSAIGYRLDISHPLADGTLELGVDGRSGENNATVRDPDVAAFYIDNYHNANSADYGFFVEWRGDLRHRLHLELGVRYDRVVMDADPVNAQPADLPLALVPGTPPFAIRTLRDNFNALERSRADNNFDWVAKLGYELTETTRLELGLARKTRSPDYIERYSWIPLEINAGLGDGNNYVGDVSLEPEVSHQVELGLDWRTTRAYFTPRLYYRRIDNYIQGMPVTNMLVRAVSGNANGDPNPLQFTNVDAEIYGFDAMFGARLNEQWRLDGTAGYTRGKRRDIDDDLYRIAPLNGRLRLTYEKNAAWSATVEGVAWARQNHVSRIITANSAVGSSRKTPGHVIANIYGQYAFQGSGIKLQAGVENLFDKDYIDHLSGFNRVAGSGIPIGERLHGPGRNVYVTLTRQW